MAASATHRLGGGDQCLDHFAEDGPEDGQRESGAGLGEVDDGRRSQEAASAP